MATEALTHICSVDATPADRGYSKRPKKGKPIPKGPLQRRIQATCGSIIALVGPDFVGLTTTLRRLEATGYTVRFLGEKPTPPLRDSFHEPYFLQLVE